MQSPKTAAGSRASRLSTILLAIAAVVGIGAVWALLPIAAWLEMLRVWVQAQGILGHVAFALIYAAATVLLAPGAALTLAAGVAFGLGGFPAVLLGAVLGATLSFLIGRYVARGWVERQAQSSPLFKAVDKAIESEGWKIVALMRLSPLVPFNLQNYFFGITKIGFWPYLLTTAVGILPGTLLYVWIGSLGANASMGLSSAMSGEAHTTSMLKLTALGVGLVATLLVTVIISRKAGEKLREAGVGAA